MFLGKSQSGSNCITIAIYTLCSSIPNWNAENPEKNERIHRKKD